jgi:hypothetical protein
MLSTKIHTAIATLTALTALAFPVSALAVQPLQWITNLGEASYGQQPVGGSATGSYPRTYSLSNDLRRGGYSSVGDYEALIYAHETFGVDLGFYGPFDFQREQWRFIRQPVGHATTQIPATEQVALYNTESKQYLVSEYQHFGINLGWSTTPQYQWQVAEGLPNEANANYRTELYNTGEKAYLVEYERYFGANLAWDHAPFSIPNGYQAPVLPVPARPVIGGATGTPPVTTTPPVVSRVTPPVAAIG